MSSVWLGWKCASGAAEATPESSGRAPWIRAGEEEHLRLEELKVDMQALEDQNAELEDLS